MEERERSQPSELDFKGNFVEKNDQDKKKEAKSLKDEILKEQIKESAKDFLMNSREVIGASKMGVSRVLSEENIYEIRNEEEKLSLEKRTKITKNRSK